jgi:hypothetical protein
VSLCVFSCAASAADLNRVLNSAQAIATDRTEYTFNLFFTDEAAPDQTTVDSTVLMLIICTLLVPTCRSRLFHKSNYNAMK